MKAKSPDASTSYEIRRYAELSPIPASQATNSRARAWKKPVRNPLTYQDLLDTQERLVSQGSVNPRTAANRASVLRSFLKLHKIQTEDFVGQEFRTLFRERAEEFLQQLRAQGRAQHNITNTLAALKPWRVMLVAIDTESAISGDNLGPFNQAFKALLKDYPIGTLAKQLCIPRDMVYGWVRGKRPRMSNASHIHRVEAFFGVEHGELAVLAGFSDGRRIAVSIGKPATVNYRDVLLEKTSFHYLLKPDGDSPLREEWRAFLQYKTEWQPTLARVNNGVWRLAPFVFGRETESSWASYLDGVEVPSARMGWSQVASYLGWLALPKEDGGPALPVSSLQTLAWLGVREHVDAYIRWMVRRCGNKFNGSVFEFLAKVKSVLRADSGYLSQQADFLRRLPASYLANSWTDMCQGTFSLLNTLSIRMRKERRQTRDPKEPMRHILELEKPLDMVADMVMRLRVDRPIGNSPINEAAWARDVALIKLMVSNPLRLRNMATLTWRSDNSGQLYQRADGSWWIRIERNNFKNTRGAAGNQDYDMPVQPMAWSDLERYLRQFRPRLLKCESDFVFLAMSSGPRKVDPAAPWTNMSGHIRRLTKKYLWRCAGIGAHAFRHLVATAIIKASNMSDFKTAALVLNDTLSTVEKNYAHLRSADGANRMGELLGSTLNRM